MADSSVAITAGSGTPIRVLTGLGAGTADQQVITLADSAGNLLGTATAPLPVSARVASLTAASGSITTTTSTVTASTDVPNAGSATVLIVGTYAGVNATFEGSPDGTNWVQILGQRTDSYVTETTTGVLPSNTTRAWDFPLAGMIQFRVRATAWTSGTATVVILPAVNPFEIAPTSGLAGVGTASTITGVTAAAGDTALVAVNPARRGCRITNNSTATAYIREGASAAAISSGNYSFPIPPGGTYEYPPGAVWVGAIRAIWSAANGYINVTELT